MEEQDELLAEVLERALEAGKEAVERGPDQLPVLKEAGVVDAGAYGLTVIVAGVVAALRGEEAPQLEHQAPAHSLHLPQHEDSRFRYCTNFAVSGTRARAASRSCRASRSSATRCWWWATRSTLRVHVHTDEPEAAVALFEPVGEVSRLDVADMREQIADRSARLGALGRGGDLRRAWPSPAATGMRRLYEELGAHVVDGGRHDEPVDLRAAGRASTPRPPPRSWCCRTAPT